MSFCVRSDNLPAWHPSYNTASPTMVDFNNIFITEDDTFKSLNFKSYDKLTSSDVAIKYLDQTGYFDATFDSVELDEFQYSESDTTKNFKGNFRGCLLSFARNLGTLHSAFSPTIAATGTTNIARSNSELSISKDGPTTTYDVSKFNDGAIPFYTIIELVGGGGGGGCGASPAMAFHRGGSGGAGGGYLAFVADWRPVNGKQISLITITSGSGGSGGSSSGAGGSSGTATTATIYYTDGSSVSCSANGGGGGEVTSDIDSAPVASGGGTSGEDKLVASNNLYYISSATGGNGGEGATRHRIDFNGFNNDPTNGSGVSQHCIKLVSDTTNNLLIRDHSAKSGGSYGSTSSGHIPGGGGGASMICEGAAGCSLDGPTSLGGAVIAYIDGSTGAGGGGSGALSAGDNPRGGNGGSGGYYIWF